MQNNLKQLSFFQPEICSLTMPFFRKHKIRFFGYSRTFENQQCFWLSTHPEVYEYLLKHRLPFNAPLETSEIEPFYYHYPPPDTEYFEMTYDITTQFQLHHPLDLVFQRNGYYELFCLAIDHEDRSIVNYYLNNISHFKQFCLDFTSEATRLIDKAQAHSILLPDDMFDPISNLIVAKDSKKIESLTLTAFIDAVMSTQTRDLPFFKEAKRYTLEYGKKEIQFTKRELQCLLCLLKGKSAQETADELFIDRRTVETYIDRLRRTTLTDNKLMLTTHIYRLLLQGLGTWRE